MKRFLLIVLSLIFLGSAGAQSVSEGVKAAFLDFENINMDPALDYLGGIIKGLLLYDLSRNQYIKLVNRAELEDVLDEQNLRLSGLSDESSAMKVGKILGADWLVKGEFIYLGKDVLITISLIEVESARTFVYSDRGSSENTIHSLAEKVVMKLTGMEMSFTNPDSVRSIISMKDESPGRVKFYSWVPGAEIFLDDNFIGYTVEDNKTPYLIERVEPGKHTIRTHYWPFGEVDLPEMRFHDWDEDFEIHSGEEVVIRADQRQFNSIIYDLQQLIRENYRFPEGGRTAYEKTHSVTWQDMKSKDHSIAFDISFKPDEPDVSGKIDLLYDGESYQWPLNSPFDEELELKENVRDLEIRFSWSRGRIDYSLWRTDIEQGMWQNQ